jgi:catechol 2,3-dioxygenase-like lactoylglutathione lyase family enzyme
LRAGAAPRIFAPAPAPWNRRQRRESIGLAGQPFARRDAVAVRGGVGGSQNRLMIGRLEKTVVDCPDPRALAAFYAAILGMRVNEDSDDWVVIGSEPGARQLAFQRVTHWIAPDWPDPGRPQQLHLDIRVDDADVAEREVLALGARRLPGELEGRYRVFADPAGHPFCLVFGRHDA